MACLLQPARGIPMFFSVLAIIVAAPFERPLIALPGGLTLTTVEVAIVVAAALAITRFGVRRGAPASIPLLLPGVVFVGVLAIAALAAPSDRGNAMRFAARMAAAAIVFVAAWRAIDTPSQARIAVRVWIGVASCVAAIAVLEAAQVPPVMEALTVFRPGFHVVGGQLRATSTLFYPTIASMYLEVAFALGLWLLVDPSPRRPRLERALAFAALVVIGAGIAATFTRAGLIAMATAIVLMGGLRAMRERRAHDGMVLTALTAALIVVVFVSHSPGLLAARLSTDGSQAWYGATYQAPKTIELHTGAVQRVPITITNTGRLPWDSRAEPAFALAYHWLRAGSEEVVDFEGARTAFPRVVPPGATITFEATVKAPGTPGVYTLVWDVVHEDRAWLSTEGVTPARTTAHVAGAPTAAVATTLERLPPPVIRPARPALWSAALRIAAKRPLLGVGPDNFRHVYGAYLGMAQWDERVHANNMYLEVLAGAGLCGFAALVWIIAASGRQLWRRMQQAPPGAHALAVAAFVVWVTIAGHGLVDSFLSFTTTYATFAVAAGLSLSPGVAGGIGRDAHRV